MSLRLLHSYHFKRQHDYNFTTEAGLKYSISLNNWSELSGIPDYGPCTAMILDLKVKDQAKGKKDPGIEQTVAAIALDYLQHYHDDIIVYYCLNANDQAKARHRLFLKWFDRYNPGNFCRESQIIDNEEHIFIYDTHNNSAKHFITSLPKSLP